MSDALTPTEIRRLGTHAVRVVWTDGHVSEFRNDHLRAHCPCAGCRNRPQHSLPVINSGGEDMYPVQIGLVGRYAISVEWSDGHDTAQAAIRRCTRCAGATRWRRRAVS